MSSAQPRRAFTALAISLAFAACDDGSPPVPAQITQASNTSSGGVVGQPLSPSPAVQVTTRKGDPIPATEVVFRVTGGAGEVVNDTVPTNSGGIATVGAWILGPRPGENTLTAAVEGLAPITFTATASAGAAAQLSIASGDAQSGNLNTPLGAPLVVRVADRFGNGVAGVSVTFAVTSGAGTLAATTATSDDSGNASGSLTLTQPGVSIVTTTSSAIPGGTVTFQANTGPTIVGRVTVSEGVPRPFAGTASPARVESQLTISERVLPADAAMRLSARGRLVVTFSPGAFSLPQGAAAYSAATVRQQAVAAYSAALAPLEAAGLIRQQAISPAISAALVTVAPGQDETQVMAALRSDPRVASVEEDGVKYALHSGVVAIPDLVAQLPMAPTLASERYPNDPNSNNQFWHYNMVDAPRAWVRETGRKRVRVAIVDTGIRPDHPAIGPMLAPTTEHFDFTDGTTNAFGSVQQVCGGLGTFNTVRGRAQELALPRNMPQDPLQVFLASSTSTCWFPDFAGSHGTHVGGTIASAANDGIGGTGLNWDITLLAIRALGITGSGFEFDVAQGILYAAGLPATYTGAPIGTVVQTTAADVINLSFGGAGQTTVLVNAVRAAAVNSLIVAAAGNNASSQNFFPAAYSEVVAVVALDPAYDLASYTNAGAYVDLAAPGGDFRQTSSSGVFSSVWSYTGERPDYAFYQGTSMAAPHVTGVAALVKAANPDLTPAQLRARLQQFAVDLGPPGRDDRFGYGAVNAYNSVTGTRGPTGRTTVRAISVATGAAVRSAAVGADGRFTFANLPVGDYFVVAGQDEGGDGVLGAPGRRFGWMGTARMAPLTLGGPTVENISLSVAAPIESEVNDNLSTAESLVVDSWVAGHVGGPDSRDMYKVVIPTAGTYTFETSGVVGTCGLALEIDTVLRLDDAMGTLIEQNQNTPFPTASYPGIRCSLVSRSLQPGTYYIEVAGQSASASGTYRLHVRSGP